MAPFKRPVILDNDVISRLYSAEALRRVLEIWPKGSFYVTERVIDEAGNWVGEGNQLVAILKDLEKMGVIQVTDIDDSSEKELSAFTLLRLGKRLGSGESASIAIAYNRGFDVATDDRMAREVCRDSYPSINIFGTGDLLNMAVRDGILTQREVNSIQAKIRRGNI